MLRHQILVLEDENDDANAIQTALQRSGFSPAMVSSAQEAVLHAETSRPDLMLVDGNAAGDGVESGFLALGRVRSHLDIPLVFLLPYGDENAMERAVARAQTAGPDSYILRPYQEHELVQTLRSVLREHEATRLRAKARTYSNALAEITPDYLIAADVTGNVLYLNPAARRLRGLVQDLPTDLHLSAMHPAWANATVLGEGIETAILDGVWHGEAALLAWDGKEVPVSEVILAHTGPDGKCEFLSLLARDITELKQTEDALRASEQMYRRIVETAPVGIWIVDSENRSDSQNRADSENRTDSQNRIRLANPRIAQLLGYTVEEMVGMPLTAFLDGSAFAASTEMPDRSPGPQVVTLLRKDGTHVQASLATGPVYDEQERQNGVMVTLVPK